MGIISSLLLLICLVSCGRLRMKTMDIDYLKNSDDFNDILALKYARYSDALFKYRDYKGAERFANLAIDSAKGKNEISFKLDDFLLKQDPNTLADVYFLFNCWLYFETNGRNLGEASICKDAFNKIIFDLEKKRKESLADKITADGKKQQKFLTREEEMYFLNILRDKTIDIEFDFDSYKLNPPATVKISALLKYLNSLDGDYKIVIIGHTDRAGKNIYNNTLARRRANTIRNILNKNGVPKNLLQIDGSSSRDPKIVTRSGEKMQNNRRVEIIVNENYKNQDLNPQPQP
ncbi:MAG: OmpA family protein [Rickettsiales bacterium]|jgi:outer membrane protein OmpA-like peptidoglycan-associated protein|nr:OmpA family protein [Rickettsiales bacterium]